MFTSFLTRSSECEYQFFLIIYYSKKKNMLYILAAVSAGADETISAAGFFGFMGVSMALVLASKLSSIYY